MIARGHLLGERQNMQNSKTSSAYDICRNFGGFRFFAFSFAIVLFACAFISGTGCSRKKHGAVILAGSTAFQPFAEKVAERYMSKNPGKRINVLGGGSAVGIQSALVGSADIGMADLLDLPVEARELSAVVVAKDGIAIIVNPKNPLVALTGNQASDIFSGAIKNWKELGGNDSPVRVISREDGSGTRHSFDKLVLKKKILTEDALFQNSNGTVREAVANDPSAVGYISLSLLSNAVKPLAYNNVMPSTKNIRNGSYSLVRPIFFLTNGGLRPEAKAFVDYILEDESQKLLEDEGLVAIR